MYIYIYTHTGNQCRHASPHAAAAAAATPLPRDDAAPTAAPPRHVRYTATAAGLRLGARGPLAGHTPQHRAVRVEGRLCDDQGGSGRGVLLCHGLRRRVSRLVLGLTRADTKATRTDTTPHQTPNALGKPKREILTPEPTHADATPYKPPDI